MGNVCGCSDAVDEEPAEPWYRIHGSLNKTPRVYEDIEKKNASIESEIDRPKHLVICSGDKDGCDSKRFKFLEEFSCNSLMIPDKTSGRVRIGVLGGMGPLPAAEFLVELTSAMEENDKVDSKNIDVILLSNPDYQLAADGFQLSDVLELPQFIRAQSQYQKFVKSAMFDLMVAPCNTFHIMVHAGDENIVDGGFSTTIIEKLAKFDVDPKKFVSLIKSVGSFIKAKYPGQKVGLLATKNTYNFGMYKNVLKPNCVCIDEAEVLSQEGIDYVKKGDNDNARKCFLKASELYMKEGVKLILLGCTEIPLALNQADLDARFPGKGMTAISTISCGVDGLMKALVAKHRSRLKRGMKGSEKRDPQHNLKAG